MTWARRGPAADSVMIVKTDRMTNSGSESAGCAPLTACSTRGRS